jgi:hypothetical protein
MTFRSDSNRPTFIAYTVTERTGRKNVWTPVGAAWPHTSAKGFTIKLHALPLNGHIVLLEPRQDEASPAEQSVADDTGF